jgi:acyl carrier protein
MRAEVRVYIVQNFLVGGNDEFNDATSLVDNGIVDSTGALEIVEFLEKTFGVKIEDCEITPDNLDSVVRICELVGRKLA